MKFVHVVGLVALEIGLSGCATIIEGTTQSISIVTSPVEGAHCTLVNSEGTWYLTSPGSVVVHKTKNDLDVTCTKEGYQDATVVVPSKFGAYTVGNVLMGIPGIVIGGGVDAASGANYQYPPATVVPMTRVGEPAAAAPTTPAVAPSSSPTS